MELGLYHKIIVNFQRSKSKGWSGWTHVKILICSRKCWEIQPQLWLNHICRPFLSSSFFFSLSPSTFFAHAQVLTFYVFINHIDNLSALFQSFVISVKDDNFQSTSFFTKLYILTLFCRCGILNNILKN